MSHRRVKALSYDEDDYDDLDDDYDEGEEELSPEDKEQMRVGKGKVRQALGPTYSIPDRAIEEALYYYYYDVGKTVSYLKNEHKPTPRQQQKQPSKLDQAAAAVQKPASQRQRSKTCYEKQSSLPTTDSCGNPFSVADFFKDTPWLNVPQHLQAEILIEPLFPRGGLLGGSSGGGKPSKLAQLAAARKKKEEEKKSQQENSQSSSTSSNAALLLDRLGGKQKLHGKENSPVPISQTSKASPPAMQIEQSGGEHNDAQRQPSPTSPQPTEATKQAESEYSRDTGEVQDFRALPSSFALTMTAAAMTSKQPSQHFGPLHLNPFPVTRSDLFDEANRAFADPSPDDVVEQAQTKSKKSAPAKNEKKADVEAGGAVQAIDNLSIQDAPKVKSKNLDVAAEYRRSSMKSSASFVVVGHVDHGKSTLMGRLLLDLKVVDQRSIDKLRKEAETIGKSSFALAWVMDQTSDERSRGVTVDIATHNFETEKTRFTILDAPGHRDFIPNMIAGASQADFAVMVIDAGTDSFESGLKGQTKEHALLVRAIGVQRVIVAINKMDSISWSQSRFEEIQQQMSAFFASAGFQSTSIAFVPCSGLTGDNIVQPVSKSEAAWYNGPTFVAELDAAKPAERGIEKPLRMSVSDIFRGSVTNPLSITGRIEGGNIQIGDQILVQPAGETATIKGIEVDNETMDWAVAGMLPTLHLTDIDPVHIRSGDVICNPGKNAVRNIKAFEVKILAFDHVMPQRVDVHKGRTHVPGRVGDLLAVLDSKSAQPVGKKKPRVVQPGAMARVMVELEQALPLEVPDRVVLRAEGNTIAAGLLDAVVS
ncbi:MAG: Hsp70 suppressor, GTPase facilitates ribosomal subunit dissociation [Bogoriella megaspora]|nr:MAG: Hsp70 suppressor, GTPase facilitates ribosomal subunit dissociation [Bogoriella megaspora]